MCKRLIPVLGLTVVLTACGTTPEERGISGAGVGAGAGAIVGAVTGLSVVQGAVLGAVAGGLTGAMTDKNDVDLGEPAWKQGNTSAGSNNFANNGSVANDKQTVITIQQGLKDMGYNPGTVDGINGKQTQQAIRAYQKDHGLLVDGMATTALMKHIKQNS